ncbi:uncharacterized protein si:ch73-257c13.2 [Trichomycterus rosablanca]|uniref:uncharacterized protein si:ch73-257c13.2 n=1 Tax=Trichomycterus rosablanca TaxID=2290929 RepID=UPI002F360F9D
MALETCIAFLLADELDAEDYASLKNKPNIKTPQIRDDEDDDDDKDNENVFTAIVPSLSVLDFQKCFQLTQTQVEELVNLLSPFQRASCKLAGWTMTHTVLASLWTLSALESYSSIAARFHTKESIIHQRLNEFCSLVTRNLADQIRWPRWQEADDSAAGFYSDVGLPGIVCVVGSCLISTERPVDVLDPDVYQTPDKSHSMKLIAFCNNRGKFTHVNAGHPGSWHNSRVLRETDIGKALREDPLNLLHDKHIIGDATFPLSEHLLTPFPDYGTLAEKKLRYNIRAQAALRVVRDSLRSLMCRFQRLRSLQMNSVTQISMAVKTCCILFNVFLETDRFNSVETMEEHEDIQLPFHELPNGHSGSLGGISKRQDIAACLGRKPKKR